MWSIRIIDKDFNLIGEVDSFESFSHTRRYRGSGGFDLRIDFNQYSREYFKRDNILIFNKNPNLVGIVEHCEVDGAGVNDFFVVRGKTLSGLLERRVIVPDGTDTWATAEGKQESIIKKFVDKNCVNPSNSKRKIERLEIAPDKKRGADDKWRSAYDCLEDKLNEICEYAKMGYDVALDIPNKKFIFDIYVGRNVTVDQNELPPVIFSKNFGNVLNRKYTESAMGTYNSVYAGTREETGKMILNYGETETGMARRESFLQVSEETVEAIKKEAELFLEENKTLETFELDVDLLTNFKYEEDYFLGDTVTIVDPDLKITTNSQIVEVIETYQGNTRSLKLTFDKLIPNLLDKLRKL